MENHPENHLENHISLCWRCLTAWDLMLGVSGLSYPAPPRCQLCCTEFKAWLYWVDMDLIPFRTLVALAGEGVLCANVKS